MTKLVFWTTEMVGALLTCCPPNTVVPSVPVGKFAAKYCLPTACAFVICALDVAPVFNDRAAARTAESTAELNRVVIQY